MLTVHVFLRLQEHHWFRGNRVTLLFNYLIIKVLHRNSHSGVICESILNVTLCDDKTNHRHTVSPHPQTLSSIM